MTNTTIQNRYLSTWNHNAALILGELEKIINARGGRLCTKWSYGGTPPEWVRNRKLFYIQNRHIIESIRKEKERLERLNERGQTHAANVTRETIAGLEKIPNDPVLSYYGEYRYITFALDGYYYYYSMDDNPFFDFHFAKMKINEHGQINRHYIVRDDKKEWLCDCFFSYKCSPEDRREAAYQILNMLLSAETCRTFANRNGSGLSNIIYFEEV